MSIRSIIDEIARKVDLGEQNKLHTAFNFTLWRDGQDEADLFHLALDNEIMAVKDGLAENEIAQLEASEETLEEILDLGLDPVDFLMKFAIPEKIGQLDLPDIDSTIFVESSSRSGKALRFNFKILENSLQVFEGENQDCDIQIKIKGSFLQDLIEGDANIPMALLTRKIKIKNKRELFQLLARFGLKF